MADKQKGIDELASNFAKSSKEIKQTRAVEIAEDIEVKYRRTVEDLDHDLTTLERKLKNSLDLSPDNAHSFIKPSEFDAAAFVKMRGDLRIAIRNAKVKANEAKDDYNMLFGQTYTLSPID